MRIYSYNAITEGGLIDVIVSVKGLNDCAFVIDGPSPNDECGRIIRKIIDKCDQTGTQYKQGGAVTSNCAIWRFDPVSRSKISYPYTHASANVQPAHSILK